MTLQAMENEESQIAWVLFSFLSYNGCFQRLYKENVIMMLNNAELLKKD